MSYKEITDGEKLAHAKSARFIKSEKGTTGIEIAFEFEEPSTGKTEKILWVGWLSEKAIARTMDTLVNVLGYNGNDTVDDNGVLTDKDAFDWNKQVKLVIEHEEYEGKSYPRVKWVNAVGGSAFQSCKPETVKADLAQIGFRAAFLAAKQATGSGNATDNKVVPF